MNPFRSLNGAGSAVLFVLGMLAAGALFRVGWEVGGRLWAIL